MLSTTTETKSYLFTIAGDAYVQVTAWQQRLNVDILRYQLKTRGYALVKSPTGETGNRRITELPGLGETEPYYGAYGGAYRYTFHPMENYCELEVSNQMGGFAYYYLNRIDPLRMRLPFQIGSIISSTQADTTKLVTIQPMLSMADALPGAIQFYIPAHLGKTLSEWVWFGRPLPTYDFIFVPTTSSCTICVKMRDVGATLWLSREEFI